MNLTTGPLTREIYEIMRQHDQTMPASLEQTALCVRLSAFGDRVETAEKELTALREELKEAKDVQEQYERIVTGLRARFAGSVKGAEQQDSGALRKIAYWPQQDNPWATLEEIRDTAQKALGNDVRQSSDPITSVPRLVDACLSMERAIAILEFVWKTHPEQNRRTIAGMEMETMRSIGRDIARYIGIPWLAEGSPQLSDAVNPLTGHETLLQVDAQGKQPPQPPPSAQLAERVRELLKEVLDSLFMDHVIDPKNDGTYSLVLGETETRDFFEQARLRILSAILPLIQDNRR